MVKKIFRLILGLPKSIILSIYYFGFFKAIRLPILVSPQTRIAKLGNKNAVILLNFKTGAIRVGLGDGSFNLSDKKKNYWMIGNNAKLIIHDNALFSRGTILNVNGTLEIMAGFRSNSGFLISVENHVVIGSDCLVGWNVTILDADGHKIFRKEEKACKPREVIIGNHVWLCSGVTVLKGTVIGNGCVVGANSNVAGIFDVDNQLLAGNPAKVLRSGIGWSI